MQGFSLAEEIRAIVSESLPPEALRQTLAALERMLRPRSLFVATLDPHVHRLNVVVTRGRSDRRMVASIPGEGPIGTAFTENRIVREGNLLAVPMAAGGEAVGAVVLLGGKWAKDDGPSEEELARVQVLVSAAAAVVTLARSREESERRSRDLQSAIEQLEAKEKVRDSILSHLSHELRTPLTTIKAYLQLTLLGRLGPLGEKQRDALAICERNADRLLRLINDLLLTARLESGKMTLDPKALGLRSVLTEATELLHDDVESAAVKLRIDAPQGEVFIRGNRDRLVEAFMHLLERGLRGDRRGMELRVEVAPQERAGSVRFTLEGVHADDGELAGLFQAFRPEGGSPNLGLSIARQIFQLHGGSVRAEAGEEGLIFHVSFPLFAGVVATGARGPSPRKGEILVVEDDDDCRNGIVDYLTAERFQVRAYADGRRALERIMEEPPALLLVDLRIPGVDGARLIQQVREGAGPSTPIYVISGAIDSRPGQEEAWGERVDGVFEKPINFPYLLERVREYVAPR